MGLRKQLNKERVVIRMRAHIKPIELRELAQQLERDKLEYLKAIYTYYECNGTTKKIRLTSESTMLVAEAEVVADNYKTEKQNVCVLFSDGDRISVEYGDLFVRLISSKESKLTDKKGLSMVVDTDKDYKLQTTKRSGI